MCYEDVIGGFTDGRRWEYHFASLFLGGGEGNVTMYGKDFESSRLYQQAAVELPDCDEIVVDNLAQTASNLNSVPNDLRVAHLNICSMRSKMEELRKLQVECNFDIIGINETHLDKSV